MIGTTLHRYCIVGALSQDGLPPRQFLQLAVPLAGAIAAAHRRGIIHRDLTPADIMANAGGRLDAETPLIQ